MSWEGIGLSVTYCDAEVLEAWSYIARLGGTAPVTLRRVDGTVGRFVLWDRSLEAAAKTWGVEQGLLQPVQGWTVTWRDEETGERMSSDMETREDAEGEAESYAEAKVRVTTLFLPTPTLTRHWWQHFQRQGRLSSEHAVIEATNLMVSSTRPALDGIWWEERLDPMALSAPRGVILPHALPRWTGSC